MRQLNDHIKFDNGIMSGTGKIKGLATTELPVLGVGYIIEVEQSTPPLPNEKTPYTHIVMYDVHIRE